MNTAHEVLAERIAATPDKVAVRGDDCVLTYAELDARANRVAERLRALGMGRESTVGVLARRSVELVVTLLGVLKSGAAYVPVDPRQPDGWRTTALRSVGVRHLVDERGTVLPGYEAAGPDPDAGQASGTAGGNLAYVAFTSGSTGTPRGVAVPHEAVLRLALDPTCAPLDPHDRYLQFAPVAFDASTFEIWPPLLGGAELVVHPASEPSPAELAEFISEQKITTLWMTAGLFQLMVDAHVDRLAGVRRLVVGGDVVSPRHAAEILARVPGLRLVNGYGPTENTTFTCCHEVVPGESGPLPIGRPITGTDVRVLDARLRPTLEGELYAVGLGLARGYAGAPGLTAARFVCDPWSSPPGGRMYRTGDRVRVRPDGVLEFLGRTDRQVKINGFRVEPGEVESALAAQPGVRAVAVVAQPTTTGTQRLIAFVAPHRGQVLSVLGLRKQAAAALPDYARPASYRVVDDLPLTVNGKVDRAELAGLVSRERPDLFTDYVPPRSPLEEQIAEMWSDLLGIDRIGVDDDFIVLGGYSLLSMRMTADIATEFGVALTPRDFYLRPTVARLAALIEERTR
ncbi:thioester reductase [Streptomyces sp. SA15]|uniref:non-ribosomal peptide synthetase n=1 Tax=Streptomyces sp. SA15 TaxID=934019 RepID=UPI000BAF0F75|nr:non-ribosomal peptide synthetase [Streptomyces sp. SA15]PAZ12875.1 thioester reductase [Streptomyces sp. SA15]